MKVPLTVNDFLTRGATVYPDRLAVVDEPDQPAPSLGELTFAELAARQRRIGVAMDRLGLPMGARVAMVARYVDVTVADGGRQTQRTWRDGLRAVSKSAKKRFKKDFARCDAEQQDAVVAEMARNEGDPTTDLERFFAVLKRATLDGYYTSKVGIHEDLNYQGNSALADFPGCTHPEHA